MFTESVTSEFAAQLELTEVKAWLDLYAAAPADFAREFQLEIRQVQDVVLTRCRPIPFIHFNCVLNLGVSAPTSEPQVDELLALYREANIRGFAIYHNPHCRPAELPEWFNTRKLRVRGGWDRIYRDNAAPGNIASLAPANYRVERVTPATAHTWADYLDASYGLPTKPWLLALVERPGWHHYLLRREDRIAAVRSMYIHPDGMAWLGIEAPVPGIMAPSYDLDFQICQAMVRDGLAAGVNCFVADIEAPTVEMNTAAYRHFESLGFKRAYFRSHYAA